MTTSTSSGYMTAKDPVIVKRKYLKPMPPDPEFENMDKRTAHYKHKLTGKKCITCNNMATQLLCCDVDGAIFTEKYCDSHKIREASKAQ